MARKTLSGGMETEAEGSFFRLHPIRKQRVKNICSLFIFSIVCSLGPWPTEWCHSCLGKLFPPQYNLENPSPICPELCSQGDSRSCQIDNQYVLSQSHTLSTLHLKFISVAFLLLTLYSHENTSTLHQKSQQFLAVPTLLKTPRIRESRQLHDCKLL